MERSEQRRRNVVAPHLVLALVAASLLGCREAAEAPRIDRTLSVRVIADFFERRDCRGAMRYLDTAPETARTPEWYDYRSQTQLLCGEHDRTGAHDRMALRALDDGLARYPDAPELLAAKAAAFEWLRDPDHAMRYYVATHEEVRRRRAEHRATASDEVVLERLATVRPPAPQQTDSDVPIVKPEPTLWVTRVIDDARAGNCTAALATLHGGDVTARSELWYELLAQSNVLCFSETKQPSYLTSALQTVDEALGRHPNSLRLRVTRAQLAELAGDSATANQSYAETLRTARHVIEKNANVVDVVEADRLVSVIVERQRKLGLRDATRRQ